MYRPPACFCSHRAALELLPDAARPEAAQAIVAAIEGAPPVDLPRTRTL